MSDDIARTLIARTLREAADCIRCSDEPVGVGNREEMLMRSRIADRLAARASRIDGVTVRAAINALPYPPMGCICPPTSERTCGNQICPRKAARA